MTHSLDRAPSTNSRQIANPTMNIYGSRLVAVALAFVLLVTLDAAAYTYCGSPWGLTVLFASVLAFVAWLMTTFRRAPGPPSAFILYMGTVTALVLFEAEEWSRHMPSRVMELYPDAFPPGIGLSDHAFIAVFPLAASALFVLGGLTYYHGSAFGRFAAWFTFSWAVVASLSVYAFAMMSRAPTAYIGGMITAPLPLLLGIAGMVQLVRHEGRPSLLAGERQ